MKVQNTFVSWSCPFCCKETFSSVVSLKNHILDMKNKLNCPICETNFEDFDNLTLHLKDCNLRETIEEIDESSRDLFADVGETMENNQEGDGPPSIDNENSEVLAEKKSQYFCEICNVDFGEMKKHLVEFHMGQEVVVESQNLDEVFEESDIRDDQDINSETSDNIDSLFSATDTEPIFLEEVLNENVKLSTKKLTKINVVQKGPVEKPPAYENIVILGQAVTVLSNKETIDAENVIKVYRCQKCNLRFSHFPSYSKHDCNSNLYKVCEICSMSFKTKGALTLHRKKLHGIMKVVKERISSECDVCHIVFPSSKSMALHRKMHDLKIKPRIIDPPATYNIVGKKIAEENNEVFTCHVCGKEYNKKYEEVHMKSHVEELLNCPICNRKFADKEDLSMHAQAHRNEIDTKMCCSFCKKVFTTEKNLREHLENQCEGGKYGCNFCGRKFLRPHEKVKHERIHTGQKPHICEVCGKGFRVSYCLTLHLRTHSGIRPYHCQTCGKRFKSYSVFNHHMQTHSDARPYECPFCPKTFKTSVQLAGHKNTHTKPFTCNVCNRPFASLYAVRLHTKSHDRVNNLNHQCHICGAVYARSFALRDHLRCHPKWKNENLKKIKKYKRRKTPEEDKSEVEELLEDEDNRMNVDDELSVKKEEKNSEDDSVDNSD